MPTSIPPRAYTVNAYDREDFLHDYNAFAEYCSKHTVLLTPNGDAISGKHLPDLNALMSQPLENITVRHRQNVCPLLNLFYWLSVNGHLFEMGTAKGTKLALIPTERLNEFKRLSPTEQYFFLLETLWVDSDWDKMITDAYRFGSSFSVVTAVKHLGTLTPEKEIDLRNGDHRVFFSSVQTFMFYFAYFGFWDVTIETAQFAKTHIFPTAITPTAWGVAVARVLTEQRHWISWNLPMRRKEGERRAIPGSPVYDILDLGVLSELSDALAPLFGEETKKKRKKITPPRTPDHSGEPFFLAFVPLVEKGSLQHTLPRPVQKFQDGTYIFKVALSNKVWRRIAADARHMLTDLHYAIQDAFRFDSDHLYSFFMDNKAWSDDSIDCPEEEDAAITTDEVKIGDLGITPGKRFLYIFDYGDEWRFHITLEEIRSEKTRLREPKIIESVGKAPPQYHYEEGEYEDDEE